MVYGGKDPDDSRQESTANTDRTVRRKGRRYYKAPPRSLIFAAIIAMIMSAMYLFKAFSYMPKAIDENDIGTIAVSFAFIILYFLMFVRFVIALFRLSSGSRKAWVTTVRMAITYIILAVVSYFFLPSISSDVALGIVTIPWWIMSAVMAVLIVYMFIPKVRNFFTPAYADDVGAVSWFFYLLGLDPFRGSRMKI